MKTTMFTEQWYREQAQCCAYEGDWEGESFYTARANKLAAATKAAEETGMTVGDYLFREGWSTKDIQKLIGVVSPTPKGLTIVSEEYNKCSCGCCAPDGEGMGVMEERTADIKGVVLSNGKAVEISAYQYTDVVGRQVKLGRFGYYELV